MAPRPMRPRRRGRAVIQAPTKGPGLDAEGRQDGGVAAALHAFFAMGGSLDPPLAFHPTRHLARSPVHPFPSARLEDRARG